MKKSRVREILKYLGINNPEVEIYETEDFLSIISKFNNGKFYNFYDAEDDNYDMTGPYNDLEEAQSFLFAKYNNAILVYKYEEVEDAVEENISLYEWHVPFYLSDLIKEEHLEDAQKYFNEDDMAQYADKKIKKYVTSIKYFLVNCETGYIRLLTTSDKLRKKTKENIINWLNEFQDSAFNEGVENQYWAEVKYEWSEDLESSDFIHICNVEEIEYIGEFIEEGEKHD